ncbi:MAG: zinc ribbon domain-containing protein [Clostridia bacterium]|nr:zinc ribbon domain-containing protein [Clostridia bacterium]
MLVGYILDLENLRREMSLPEALLMAAVFLLIGFGCMKLAARVALNKERKLAARNAARPAPIRPEPAPVSGGFCPKCGAKHEAGDSFCVRCGAKL